MIDERDRRRLAIRKYLSQSKNTSAPLFSEEINLAKFKKGITPENEKFTFFWEPSSPFSQWYISPFIGRGILWDDESFLEGFPSKITFNCAYQYMMYHKAMLFLDRKCAQKILLGESPKEQKRLGRNIQNFHKKTWQYYRTSIVYWANEHKFKQNERLLQQLLQTKGTTLVEASPYNQIWGVGLTLDDPLIRHPSTWKGANLLGQILTALRIELSNGEY